MIRQIVKFLRYFYNEPKVVLKGIRNKLMQILFYLTFFGKTEFLLKIDGGERKEVYQGEFDVG
ncbi:hypothetical protein ES703_07014 [subsurface metagenome]